MVVGSGEAPPLLLVPMVGTVVFTAELLAAVAAMDAPFPKGPGDALSRSFTSALQGGAVFGGVLYLARLPGPGGLLAVALASAACVGLALFLAGHFQGSGGRGSRPPGLDG